MKRSFLDILKEKVVVFDGAMGTNIQNQNLTADDFGGERTNGCNEYLVVTKPSAIENVHSSFLEVGSDVIETDTFGAASIVLTEYGLADQSYQLNFEAAKLARRLADAFSGSGHPRFVAGSMGPTTKLPSLGHIGFKEMEASYAVQARGLVEGGADLLVVETCQDILQTKAALAGIFDTFAELKRRIPVIASVTIETMGTMLLGTEIAAALTSLEPYEIDLVGMNCATGPKEMSESVRYLCANSPKPVFVMPNAGLPENVGGHAKYKLSPDEMVYYLSHFVKDLGVNVVGGCCGTTPQHLQKLVEAVGSLAPAPRKWEYTPSSSSLYQSVPLHIDPAPVLIGERTNANGSKQFREYLGREDWEGMVSMGKEQVREGAHVLDVCAAYVGRDESRDMRELIFRFNTQITAPLMIDSTEAPVIEDALQRIGGKAIVNSVNMEDGEERMARVLPLCRKYGAAVIALTIDEKGMAKTVDRKVEIAERIYRLATGTYGMREGDLIYDTLTFTLGSGDEEFRKAGMQTIEAIREIKKKFPRVHTSLGVSNISFGLSPHARHVLNSVFLHYAIEYGLDMAIVHASKILPLYKIPAEEQEICRKLIFDERSAGYDPLQDLLKFYAGKKGEAKKGPVRAATIEEQLKNRIIEGNKLGLQEDLDEGLKKYPPLDIINSILLDGMKVVGDLFGSGQMQLPFVLQSAEVMKAAVGYLEQFMDKAASTSKGTMVIATVKGDVHDIGKNLVDIILTNNGYKVVNLGIQCPLDRMLAAAEEHTADAIGMSGLLVKSTLIMKENLEVMNERGIHTPVVLGGAALTRRYVEENLRAIYRGTLSYANDAFDGLHFMEKLATERTESRPTNGKTRTVGLLVEEIEQVFRETRSLLQSVPDHQFVQPNLLSSWSIQDAVAHLSGWEGLCTERLREFAAGTTDNMRWYQKDEVNRLNAGIVQNARTKRREELMAEWDLRHRDLLDAVRAISDADLAFSFGDATIYDLVAENTFRHQRHHLKAIKELLESKDKEEEQLLGLEAKIAMARPESLPADGGRTVAPAEIPTPPFWGTRIVEEIPLAKIYPFINDAALIRGQWQVRRGKMSEQDYRRVLDEKVYPELRALQEKAAKERLLLPKVVYGYFPCRSEGDDLVVFRSKDVADPIAPWPAAGSLNPADLAEWVRFSFPRQAKGRRLCISDFFSATLDVVAFHLVTMGSAASDHAHALFKANDYKEYLYFHGLSVETAEALAEYWHKVIRAELGIAGKDATEIKKLFSQHYQGSRYSFGYPACPRLEDQTLLFELLRPERIGVRLTEGYQLQPEQSTSAIIVHHPEARYFNV